MSDKLKTLSDKIYQEGIAKANDESEKIVARAKEEARRIKEEAQNQADKIKKDSEVEMEGYRKKVEAEVRMAARKSTNQIQNALHNFLKEETIVKPVSEGLKNPQTLEKTILECMAALRRESDGSWHLRLPEKQAESLQKAVEDGKHETLQKGVTLNGDKGLLNGFVVEAEDGQYRLKFDEQTFSEFFGQFLSLETQNLIQDK